MIWYAGQPTGFLDEHGVVKVPEHGVKVVLTMSTGKIHPYPIVVSKPMLATPCADCSRPILA